MQYRLSADHILWMQQSADYPSLAWAFHAQGLCSPYQQLNAKLLSFQVAELRAERERLLNDKTSLHSQIAELREHYATLGLVPGSTVSLGSLRASQEDESAKSEAVSRLQSAQLSHERAVREWELERQQLQACC